MFTHLAGLVWLVLILPPLLVTQRGLHREIQLLVLQLTGRPEVSLVVFSLIFLPGVFLHETSHYLSARLLGVRTGKWSLIPRRLPGGKIQLGYVETVSAGWLRETIIGVAPLVAGLTFVAYIGFVHLNLLDLWEGILSLDISRIGSDFKGVYALPDFWIWLYLMFAVSSMMFPSSSDRRSWLPLGLAGGLILSMAILIGAGPWIAVNLGSVLDQFFKTIALLFSISLVIHLGLLFTTWITRLLLMHLQTAQVT